jgi:hypothetical protein
MSKNSFENMKGEILMPQVMSDTDKLMQEQFLPFYRRVMEGFKQNHHTLFAIINSFMSNRTILYGIRVTENDKTVGEYTLHLNGATISHLESGQLISEVPTPFGVMRPYVILERRTVEEMMMDEQNFISNPFATKMKYMHDVTIKFLRS